MTLTQAMVRELLDYDPKTGILIWRVRDRHWFKRDGDQKTWNKIFAGKETGSPDGDGYLQCTVLSRAYKAHRLIWLWMTGEWPKDEIDHENHIQSDNRWLNLRVTTNSGNMKNRSLQSNNTSGTPGVSWSRRDRKWRASVRAFGKKLHLGSFSDKSDAIAARKAADIKYGYHPNHGMLASPRSRCWKRPHIGSQEKVAS